MNDIPNKADFIANERRDEYEARFSVQGTIRVTIKAGSLEEARQKAQEMAEDEEFGLEIDEADDVSVGWVGKSATMYLVTRDGQKMQVSRLESGDIPRQPDERGF